MIVEADDGRTFGHAKDCADVLTGVGVANAHALLRDWIRRGLLKPVTTYDRRPVYAMTDVYAVESSTRRGGKRKKLLAFSSTITHT